MDDPWINGSSREFTVSISYRLCVSRGIATWQIVYLLYEDACPIIAYKKTKPKINYGRHKNVLQIRNRQNALFGLFDRDKVNCNQITNIIWPLSSR